MSIKFDFGGCEITATSCKPDKLDALNHLLDTLRDAEHWQDASEGDVSPKQLTVDLDQAATESSLLVPSALDQLIILLGRAMTKPSNLLWIDAATLICPDGRAVLVAGPSLAGKTTLALSMFLAYRWKVLSEDVTLIDPLSHQIIPFLRPSSLRPGCAELIEAATGRRPSTLLFDRWFFDRRMFLESNFEAKPVWSIKLDALVEGSREPLTINPVSTDHFVRSILPISNTLRFADGVAALSDFLSESSCFKLSGGTVRERMEAVSDLVSNHSR
jgi:hypothetical protein